MPRARMGLDQNMSCHKMLATSSKIPSMGLGSFSQRVNARDDFGCEKNRGCILGITRATELQTMQFQARFKIHIRGFTSAEPSKAHACPHQNVTSSNLKAHDMQFLVSSNNVELGLRNGWALARKSEIPKIAFILVSSAAATLARHLHRASARCPCLGLVCTKFVGERPVSQRARTRATAQETARAAAERELTPFSETIYDSREHYERSKLLRTKKVLHERIIQIEGEGRDFMARRIDQLRWDYMYNDLVDINVTVKKFYSNFSVAVQRTIYLRGTQINIDEDSLSSFLGIQDPIPRA
ncbi:hypothetical protein PIB30_055264 [Stylosanthes scabra]|uniref:Uncharacterized protein n=1 Tax=Stylosanthes scabra TaxID=79078 RepID=A0ABU6QJR6_9FABA|nr:hypothetical protein [Stylosanthes scabra]